MHKNPLLKRFSGILLIAVFALCNTPVKVLHHLFANHVDYQNHHLADSNSVQLHTAGIDCHCQGNVVVSPYAYTSSLPISGNFFIFISASSCLKVTDPYYRVITSGLRGPPLVIS